MSERNMLFLKILALGLPDYPPVCRPKNNKEDLLEIGYNTVTCKVFSLEFVLLWSKNNTLQL